MKETVNKYLYDSSTAFATGTAATEMTDGKSQLLIAVLTILAPVIRDVAVKVFDWALTRMKAKKAQP